MGAFFAVQRVNFRDQRCVDRIAAHGVELAIGDGGVENRLDSRPDPSSGFRSVRIGGGTQDRGDMLGHNIIDAEPPDDRIGVADDRV